MKKDKKVFIIIEVILAVIVIALTIGMLQGRNKKDRERIAVIIENSDDNQWAAFKYGLEMAAEDLKVELFVVSKETNLTAEEERSVIESEIKNGADAVIVQPAAGADMEEMLKKIYKKVPLLLIEEIVDNEGNTTDITIVGPDDYAMGITLAEELLADSNENIKGKTLGLVSEKNDSAAAIKREKGFCDAMKDAGAKICWRVADSFSEEPENAL